jgi:hypothetical protein
VDQHFKTSTLKGKEQNEESESGMSSKTLQHQQNETNFGNIATAI